MYKFSIIVVSLNTKKKFLKTIKSIKDQTYKNYETIIVDGKSTDGTIEEILKLKRISRRFKFIIEKDKGIYDAMNKGIKKCSGKWVIFLNSGDIFYKNNVLKNILKKNIKDSDIVYSDTVIDTKKIVYKTIGNNFSYKTLLMPFCHQSSLVKSKYLKKNKFDLNYKLSSDFNFFLSSFCENLKFSKCNFIISKVEAYGQSDLNRQKVFNENMIIFFKKKFYFKVFIIFLIKIFASIKYLIKIILPTKTKEYLIKFKYHYHLFK